MGMAQWAAGLKTGEGFCAGGKGLIHLTWCGGLGGCGVFSVDQQAMEVEQKIPAETSGADGGGSAEGRGSGAGSADYRVELSAYNGPLDLLLYLIRKEEVDIYDIPVARITEQYLQYIELMSELDIDVAGEFMVMAATLLEMKARMMAPEPVGEEGEEEAEDPRLELVRQLMEYRRFKEAALALTERAQERGKRFSRPGERVDEKGERVVGAPGDVGVWLLLEAFSRVLEATGTRGPHEVNLELMPQAETNRRLEERVRQAGRIMFLDVFEERADRVVLVSMFVGVLELVRQQVMVAEQDVVFGPIWLTYVPPEARERWEDVAVEISAAGDDEVAGEVFDEAEEARQEG